MVRLVSHHLAHRLGSQVRIEGDHICPALADRPLQLVSHDLGGEGLLNESHVCHAAHEVVDPKQMKGTHWRPSRAVRSSSSCCCRSCWNEESRDVHT